MIPFADVLALVAAHEATVVAHSGKVGKGDVFVALPKAVPVGEHGPDYSGAENFLADAVRAGAAYAVCVEATLKAVMPLVSGFSCRFAVVPDTRSALGELAAAHYKTANSGVALVGITGTNGKTTSTYLLETVLRAAGRVPGVIGTVEYRWPGHEEAAPLTTPDCLALHSMIADMGSAGADMALMEVSSHAIEQNRIAGLAFAGALFTNLTQDHLDYHGDMEEYFLVKARLFANAPAGAALAVNIDDPYGARLFEMVPGALGYGFTRRGERILAGELLDQSRDGLRLRMAHAGVVWELASPLVGEFNASNLLGAQALALALGVDEKAFAALASFGGVPGRLERVADENGYAVFVDYAHTPDALVKAISALRGAKFSQIVTVFGCGGNRDRAKRPLMGEAAAALSDVVVLTSDNPRHEDPLAIMADVRPGLASARNVIEQPDRKKAIAAALAEMRPGGALLVAGKGHESYQIVGDARHPFSDRQTIRELLACA